MATFHDENAARKIQERLETLTGHSLEDFLDGTLQEVASPDQALVNLERWLKALSNPGLHLEHLMEVPRLARLLMVILGGSQPLADTLIQNPELASLILDPALIALKPTRQELRDEGRALLSAATSFSHAMDRLRFLRQRWTLQIVVNDLAGSWPQEEIWAALSDLADIVIELTADRVWQESPASEALQGSNPLLIVGFGKLGGREVNYSSDIDLVFVVEDGLPTEAERHLIRYGEAVSRALADPMGRGFLYRVDLRLRPYGKAGPLMPSLKATENYYRLYAEPWEIQALLRSRPIYGPEAMMDRWRDMVEQQCFRPAISEASLEPIVGMRERIEEIADGDDLKRGPGGIRDVEFLVQTEQLIHGYSFPAIRYGSTCEVLRALDHENLLPHAVTVSLIEGYTFLRQLEHRIQLVANQQTHSLPQDLTAKDHLARLMNFDAWKQLSVRLQFHRRTIQTLYQSIVNPAPSSTPARQQLLNLLGSDAHAVAQWFDPLPESDAFYAQLVENQDSLGRVRKIVDDAPALIGPFRKSLALTELLLSGEIEERDGFEERLKTLSAETPLAQVAEVYTSSHTRILAQWVLDPVPGVNARLTRLLDSLLQHCMHRLYGEFDVIALGSFGRQDVGFESDADLLFLTGNSERHLESETQAQSLIAMMGALRRFGAPIDVDLRLRPGGGEGLLVRTHEGFRAYELESMEMWERFALGSARIVSGNEESCELVLKAAYALPLTPERLKELIAMKKRVESERVKPQHLRRDVKLGHGGLGDIEWFVHLHEMRYPTATKAGASSRLDEGIRSLGRARLINAVEVESLLEALHHLLNVRLRLSLLGFKKDLVPENPDKLEKLARAYGDERANEFLLRHERVIDAVRFIYTEGMERLKA